MTVDFQTTTEQRVRSDYVERNMNMQVARAEGRHAQLIDAASTRMVRPRFLDDPLIPCGVITLLSGRAGVSKSTLTIDRAALATRGRLRGDYEGRPVNVAFSAFEDLPSMQKARLIAADANMSRVRFLGMTNTTNGVTVDTGMRIPDDLAEIRSLLKDAGIRMWVIDPITSVIRGNSDKEDDVRAVFDPLAALAADLNIAIVAVRHFNKGGGYAGDKVSGSHAFRDAVRSLILVARDDEDGSIVATLDKSNYTMSTGCSYSYALTSFEVPDDEGQMMTVPKVTGFMPTERSVGEIINRNYAQPETPKRAANHEVLDWLRDYLGDGEEVPFDQIRKDAISQAGYSAQQIRDASKREGSGIVKTKDPDYTGRGQRYKWRYDPSQADTD